jgi:hypothetical protein
MSNFKIVAEVDPQVLLDPDTFCPMKTLNLKVKLLYDAQHDGHPWTEDDIRNANSNLIGHILSALGPQIDAFVREVNPFSIHA